MSNGYGEYDQTSPCKMKVIGATTLNEYRQYIEKDGALERRFQPILVNEPTKEDAIAILR